MCVNNEHGMMRLMWRQRVLCRFIKLQFGCSCCPSLTFTIKSNDNLAHQEVIRLIIFIV